MNDRRSVVVFSDYNPTCEDYCQSGILFRQELDGVHLKNRSIPCLLDVSEAYEPKARWAVTSLLRPLGLVPTWVNSTDGVTSGLAYVTSDYDLPANWLRCVKGAQVEEMYARRLLPPDNEMTVLEWNGMSAPAISVSDSGLQEPSAAQHGIDTADLVASAFLWLSGWAEHLETQVDRHGRHAFEGSFMQRSGNVAVPVVDVYRMLLAEAFARVGEITSLQTWNGCSWAFCPTFDIDYLRKWRPGILYRETVQRLLLGRPLAAVGTRLRRAWASAHQMLFSKDPYRESVERYISDLGSTNSSGTFFFKADGYRPYDVVLGWSRRYLKRTVRNVAAVGNEIGLHPAYFTSVHPDRLAEERNRMAGLAGYPIRSVRQHYLRHDPGRTPRILEHSGFAFDSSLAFADHEGFRRGTCHPFQLFDLRDNRPTCVWELPLIVMESTLFTYRNFGVEEAIQSSQRLLSACQNVGGVFVGLWHNILLDNVDFPDWIQHYEHMMKQAHVDGAYVTSIASAMSCLRVD